MTTKDNLCLTLSVYYKEESIIRGYFKGCKKIKKPFYRGW